MQLPILILRQHQHYYNGLLKCFKRGDALSPVAKKTRKKEMVAMKKTLLGLKKIERRLWDKDKDKAYVDWTAEEKANDERLNHQGHREALASNPEAMTYNYRKEVFINGGFHGGSPVRTRMIDKIMEASPYRRKGREGSQKRLLHEQKRAVCENMVDSHGHQALFNFTDGWSPHGLERPLVASSLRLLQGAHL